MKLNWHIVLKDHGNQIIAAAIMEWMLELHALVSLVQSLKYFTCLFCNWLDKLVHVRTENLNKRGLLLGIVYTNNSLQVLGGW